MSFKKSTVVMLPTNEKAPIIKAGNWNKLLITNGAVPTDEDESYQHLYFLSDEEIKEGDWIYKRKDGYETVQRATFPLNLTSVNKKIIATTDSSLTNNSIYGLDSFDAGMFGGSGKSKMVKLPSLFNLPQPSPLFVEKYVEEYNKGNVIKEVMVEYENYYASGALQHNLWQLKINPKDNTITIKKVKDSWNRQELEDALVSHYIHIGSSKGCNLGEDVRVWTKKWIEENL